LPLLQCLWVGLFETSEFSTTRPLQRRSFSRS
jgi:hypothetical protein